MFKINTIITVYYFSFEQYLRRLFVLAHNADILPDSETGVRPFANRGGLRTNQQEINIVFSIYYATCEHYRQDCMHTRQHRERWNMWGNTGGKKQPPNVGLPSGEKGLCAQKSRPEGRLKKGTRVV